MDNDFTYNEKECIVLVASGNEHAFRKLLDAYKIRLSVFIFRLCKQEHVTEEILQEVFIALWEYRERLAEVEDPSAYILATARNKTYKYLRKLSLNKKMQQEVWQRIELDQNFTQEQVDLQESSALIEKALIELSPQKQTVYRLSRNEGLNHEQIALQLGLSQSRVKNIIVEVLQHLRNFLRSNHSFLVISLLVITCPELSK